MWKAPVSVVVGSLINSATKGRIHEPPFHKLGSMFANSFRHQPARNNTIGVPHLKFVQLKVKFVQLKVVASSGSSFPAVSFFRSISAGERCIAHIPKF